jgi:predicted tellurium resistance membrane protein TerC
MGRFPVIITLGAALLGWVAGEMAIADVASKGWVDAQAPFLHYVAPATGAIGVVLLGKWLA